MRNCLKPWYAPTVVAAVIVSVLFCQLARADKFFDPFQEDQELKRAHSAPTYYQPTGHVRIVSAAPAASRKSMISEAAAKLEKKLELEPNKLFWGRGKISHFGGPDDKTISAHGRTYITQQVGRQLDPNTFYCACNWDRSVPKSEIAKWEVHVQHKGKTVVAKPVDLGPGPKRIIDVSPGVMRALGAKTDDIVTVHIVKPGQRRNS